eukprot:EG_transcript_33864
MHGDRGAQHFSVLPSVLGVPNPDLKAGIFEAPQKGGMVVVQKVVQWAGMTAGLDGWNYKWDGTTLRCPGVQTTVQYEGKWGEPLPPVQEVVGCWDAPHLKMGGPGY